MLLNEIKIVISNSHKKELRKFGLTIGIFLGIVMVFLFWKEKASAEYFVYTALTFVILRLFLPIVLKPIYIIWMSFAVILGFVMARVVLTLLYLLIFTPCGFIVRLMGKDPLNEKIEPETASYWKPRVRQPFIPSSIEKQF